jgi:hypothetical protein
MAKHAPPIGVDLYTGQLDIDDMVREVMVRTEGREISGTDAAYKPTTTGRRERGGLQSSPLSSRAAVCRGIKNASRDVLVGPCLLFYPERLKIPTRAWGLAVTALLGGVQTGHL